MNSQGPIATFSANDLRAPIPIYPPKIFPRRHAILLLKSPVKGGVIRKSHITVDAARRLSVHNQVFRRNQPVLGYAVVKADSQPFSEQLTDSAFADQEPAGGILQGDFFREIVFYIGKDVVKELLFFGGLFLLF